MSEVPKFANPLEELLAETLCKLTPPKTRKAADPKFNNRHHLHEEFANPERWTRTRGLALIHLESNTLLGNFSEYRHIRFQDARKLVREDTPMLVEGSEFVSGPQWIEWSDPKIEWERWQEVRQVVIDLHLPELGVRALAVMVDVTLTHGGVSRVELADLTHFHSDDRRSAFFLPKHVDVLEGMSFDCKLTLRAELGI